MDAKGIFSFFVMIIGIPLSIVLFLATVIIVTVYIRAGIDKMLGRERVDPNGSNKRKVKTRR